MRILIDLQGAQTESRFRGIGRYSLALAMAIIRNANTHEIFILLNGEMPDACKDLKALMLTLLPKERVIVFYSPQGVSLASHPSAWQKMAAELIREHFIAVLTPDIVYITSLFEGLCEANAVLSIGLRKSSYLTASTLYDLIPLLNAEVYLGSPEIKKWYMDKVDSLKRADVLLSISQYAKQEAIEALALNTDQVVNISSAHTDFFRPIKVDESQKNVLFAKLGITQPFLMFNSAFEHRKNVDRLIAAYAKLDISLRDRFQLLLTGKISDADLKRLKQYTKSLNVERQVFFSGYLKDDELLILFNSTHLFIFPSMHEGFGLPALEAMACGAATIGSNNTSIPEVIGLPEALFDPFDVDSIKNKISQVLTDGAFHQKLIAHGLAQAQTFSWDQSAKYAIAAFEAIYTKQAKTQLDHYTHSAEHYYQTQMKVLGSIPLSLGVPSDNELKRVAKTLVKNQKILSELFKDQIDQDKICWRLEGPFDSSYSLALLNRETALTLNMLGHQVSLHSTEGPGDFEPNPDFLKANPVLAKLHRASKSQFSAEVEVCSRNLYPPRVSDMDARVNLLHHFAWEESGFPEAWVNDFNKHLQGITCLSSHVKKIMIDHGVTVPMIVSGCGVDHWSCIKADARYRIKAKPFRFLHVSSCFPRKGADLLLKAYGQTFTALDPVTLVIKTFANPHNEIHVWLAEQQKERDDFPDVLIIEEDLTQSQLKALYRQCEAMVLPSRAEGFGLPMAEAMLSGLPVITTAWGGQLDYCNENTAWLVDYEFKQTTSHFGLFDSVWAEPNIEHLSQTMRDVYYSPKPSLEQKVKNAQLHLNAHNTWLDVTQRLVNFAKQIAITPSIKAPNKVAWVSTWSVPCGIASYSEHLLKEMTQEVGIFAAKTEHTIYTDSINVQRCWQAGVDDNLDNLSNAINDYAPICIVIQFNYGLFNVAALGAMLLKQINQGRVIVLMMHSTLDPVHVMPEQRLEKIKDTLAKCQRILVHSVADLNRLKSLGLVNNVTLFPHGIINAEDLNVEGHKSKLVNLKLVDIINTKKTIILASYGFFLPHKGLLELIEVVDRIIKMGYDVKLTMVNAQYPVNVSAEMVLSAQHLIASKNLNAQIQITADYLTNAQSATLLQSADAIIYPYQQTGESSSAAIRFGLALDKLAVVTPSAIFDDVHDLVYQLPGFSVDEMTAGIKTILDLITANDESLTILKKRRVLWRQQHLYKNVGRRLNHLLVALTM